MRCRRDMRPAALGLLALAGCMQTAAVERGGPIDPVNPETLMGRAPAAVLSDLGEPELRRREPPVEVWQYRSDDCVFDVFFDRPAGGAPPVVVYWEARSRDSGPTDAPRCLGDVIAAGRAAGGTG